MPEIGITRILGKDVNGRAAGIAVIIVIAPYTPQGRRRADVLRLFKDTRRELLKIPGGLWHPTEPGLHLEKKQLHLGRMSAISLHFCKNSISPFQLEFISGSIGVQSVLEADWIPNYDHKPKVAADAEPSRFQHFFLTHPEINVSGFAQKYGFSASILRSYINGFKTPSAAREQEILKCIAKLGKEYLAVAS